MKTLRNKELLIGSIVLIFLVSTLVFIAPILRPEKATPTDIYVPVTFRDLSGWNDANFEASLSAYERSCSRIKWKKADRSFGPSNRTGLVKHWQEICDHLEDGKSDPRRFFESWFDPWLVLPEEEADAGDGLFTGYYEPALNGARQLGGRFQHPIYKRPADLVMVDLGLFRDDLRGRRIAGQVRDGYLKPYETRKDIDNGALGRKGTAFLYLDSAIDSFFLHIQGSGRVQLPDGISVRLAYDGQNGHPYRAIGRDLIEMGAVAREDMSMDAIRNWLTANPDLARALMQKNPSYIFFREEPVTDPSIGPKGAANVHLTPGYSLAVDRKYHAMGLPVWLETTYPDGEPLKRLFIAQDTGGAIRGTIRGDVFFGFGDKAADLAGAMKQPGRMIVLLPKAVKTIQTAETN